MATPPRDMREWMKSVDRKLNEVRRTGQASVIGYVDNKIQDVIDETVGDRRTPAAPVEVVSGSFVLETYNGKRRDGYVTLSSAAVVNDVDAMPIDIAKYELWMIPATAAEGDTYTLQSSAVEPNLRSLPVEVGKTYLAKMRAISSTGTAGLFSEVQTVTVTEDTTPPPVPSSLVLGQRLGVIEATWDGLSFGSTVMPLDFWRTEIGYKTGEATDYTISTEWFEGAGTKYITGLPYNQLIYVSHRSYDYAGNVSDWTQPASITVTPLVDTDDLKRRLDDAEALIDEVSIELNSTRVRLDGELDDARQDILLAEQNLSNLNDVELPALKQRLSDAETELQTQGTELTARLTQAEQDLVDHDSAITNLETVQIPQLNADLDANTNAITDLRDVKLPALDTRLSNAQTEIDQNQTELTARLDDAFVDIGTAQSTADGAATAASDAQTAVDQAIVDLERIWSNIKRSFYWAGDTLEGVYTGSAPMSIVNIDDAPASSSVLRKVGASGGSVYWDSEPMPFDPSALYKITFKVRVVQDATNISPAYFYAGVHGYLPDANGGPGAKVANSGVISTSSAHYFAAGSDQPVSADGWVTVTGYFQGHAEVGVTGGGEHKSISDPGQMWHEVRYFSPMVLLDYPGGDGTWDVGMVSVDVVPAELQAQIVAAQLAADEAMQEAQDAHAQAGTALANANNALTMAGTKSIVYYSTSAPSGTGTNANDVWRQVDSSKNVIGEWYWTGSAWQSSKITSESIANLDVGKLSVSSAVISDAVIEKLWAEVITAKKILADQLLVGSGNNLIVDPYFTNTEVQSYRGTSSYLAGDWGASAAYGVNFYGSGSQTTTTTKTFFLNSTSVRDTREAMIPVTEGEVFRARAMINSFGGGARWNARVAYKDGTWGFLATGWGKSGYWSGAGQGLIIDDQWTVQPNVTHFMPYVTWDAPVNSAHIYGGVTVTNMATASLIVNGSITGDHLEVNSVATKVATVIKLNASTITSGTISTARLDTNAIAAATAAIQKADIKNLTVSNGTFSTAVIDALWADVITARKIETSQLLIGAMDNLIANPSFEENGRGWRNDGAAGVFEASTSSKTGSYRIHVSGVTGYFASYYHDDMIQVEEGDSYKFGFSYKLPVDTGSVSIRIYQYDKDRQYITSGIISTTSVVTGTAWGRIEGTFKVPANDRTRYLRMRIVGTSPSTSTNFYFDDATCSRMSDGSLIVDGSVDAKAINSLSVSAEVAKFINLDVSRLVASSAAISTAVIDKLWTDVIHARKITADNVLIGSGSNEFFDPGMEDFDGWYTPGNSSWIIGGGYSGTNALRVNGLSATTGSYYGMDLPDRRMKVEAGKKYRVTAMADFFYNKESGTIAQMTTPVRIYGRVYKKDASSGTYGWADPSSVAITRFNIDGVSKIEGVFEMPANLGENLFFVVGFYLTSDMPTGTWVTFSDVTVSQMTDASLIVDGGIIARHITASESMSAKIAEFLKVKAGMLEANAVTAGTIDAGAVDGVMITGSVLRTSSSSSRVQMDSSGIHAWQSGVKKFYLSASTGEISAVGDIATGVDTTYRAKLSNRNGMAALDLYTAGGASAFHGALIAWDSDIALRRYTNETAFNGELAMTGTSIFFRNSYGGLQVTSGEATLNNGNSSSSLKLSTTVELQNAYGELIMGSGFARFGKTNDGYLQFTPTGTKLTDRNLSTLIEDGTLSSTKTMYMPLISAVTTTGSANVNVNNGWTREVSSASRYKLAVQTMDESLDDKILSIEAKTWIDKSNSEIASEMMVPVRAGEERPEPPAGLLDRQPGVIAEEVLEAGLEEFVIFNKDGEIQSVMYDRLGVALIPVVKRLRDRVFSLEARLDAAGL